MKKIIRYSVAFCDTASLSTQFGTWGNCWATKEEVREFIRRSWDVIDVYGEDAFRTRVGWLIVEPVEFIRLNFFDKIFHHELAAQVDQNNEVRITRLAAQGTFFH